MLVSQEEAAKMGCRVLSLRLRDHSVEVLSLKAASHFVQANAITWLEGDRELHALQLTGMTNKLLSDLIMDKPVESLHEDIIINTRILENA